MRRSEALSRVHDTIAGARSNPAERQISLRREQNKVSSRAMTQHARGDFEVNVAPVGDTEGSVAAARLSIDKRFSGDLVGTSKGEMWTADTTVKNSGGYVAIEKIEGKLGERRGAFIVMHQGTMQAGGNFDLRIVVVPDSATGELTGLLGTMKILIAPDGKHSYELDYTLPV
jgi:hypothetical protein